MKYSILAAVVCLLCVVGGWFVASAFRSGAAPRKPGPSDNPAAGTRSPELNHNGAAAGTSATASKPSALPDPLPTAGQAARAVIDDEGITDTTVLVWQGLPIIDITNATDLRRFIEDVPVRALAAMPEPAKAALKDSLTEMLKPIAFFDIDAYLENARDKGERLSPVIRNGLLARKEKVAQNGDQISENSTDEALLRVIWKAMPAKTPPWRGLSPQQALLTVYSASSGKELAEMSKKNCPASERSGAGRTTRGFVPSDLPEPLIAEPGKNIDDATFGRPYLFADFTVYIAHQGKTDLVMPYMFRLWWSENTQQWHPIGLETGLPLRKACDPFAF